VLVIVSMIAMILASALLVGVVPAR